MYSMNKRYTVAHVRERLSEALDEAEKGVPVFIERRGVQYQLSLADSGRKRSKRRTSKIEVLDRAVADGQWTWTSSASGARFRPRRKR